MHLVTVICSTEKHEGILFLQVIFFIYLIFTEFSVILALDCLLYNNYNYIIHNGELKVKSFGLKKNKQSFSFFICHKLNKLV